jgi:circadian clock protein KaiC
VILLDHRVQDQISTRRLRIVKYRGTAHGTNEYPFLIDEDGFSVLPVSSLGLNHAVSEERISTGIADLDAMLGGGGFHRGSSILVSGVAGSGKSSVAASFVNATCLRGEKALFFSFEESALQTARNMRSIGIDLQRWEKKRLLRYVAARPTFYGLEMHLAIMMREVAKFQPQLVVLDPISAFLAPSDTTEVQAMLLRMVDFLKSRGITAIFTHLSHAKGDETQTEMGLSSLMDAWILLLNRESNGEFNRELYLLKARGMSHSNQVREFVISESGINLREPYIGDGGALTGSSRRAFEAKTRREKTARAADLARLKQQLDHRRKKLEAQIEVLKTDLASDEMELKRMIDTETAYLTQLEIDENEMGRGRGNDGTTVKKRKSK